MKTIDFKNFLAFTDITQQETEKVDITLMFSDALYKNMNGIVAHELALRIYKADAPVGFTDDELKVLKTFVESNFTPLFIDSFNANIKEEGQ